MKVRITESGKLELTPESTTESFALNQWVAKSSFYLERPDIRTLETQIYRGSFVEIKTFLEEK